MKNDRRIREGVVTMEAVVRVMTLLALKNIKLTGNDYRQPLELEKARNRFSSRDFRRIILP